MRATPPSRTRRLLGASLVLWIGACGGEPEPPADDGGAPGVRRAIVVLLDAARPDRFSSYGYGRETTPNLDALFADGVVFERCYSQGSNTRQSLPNLLYSRYFAPPVFPHSPSVPLSDPEDLFRANDPECVSLPAALAARGFTTAAVSAHAWIVVHTKLPTVSPGGRPGRLLSS